MILNDLADLFEELSQKYTHKEIARHFGRERNLLSVWKMDATQL